MSATQKQRVSTPSSAQPMRGLSARAQKMLEPVRTGFCVPIEAPGINHQRQALRKASI